MVTLFGIKNCDTVKKARRWLDNATIDYQFHDVRADGLHTDQVNAWIDALGIEVVINKRSTTWKSLSDTEKEQLNPSTAVQLIMEHPTLIKRPLLEITPNSTKEFHVGFNEKNYHTIFKQHTL